MAGISALRAKHSKSALECPASVSCRAQRVFEKTAQCVLWLPGVLENLNYRMIGSVPNLRKKSA
jgi:hypothetical protein